jgi:hypothetical protein
MSSKRFRFNNYRSWVASLMLAITSLVLTAIPALAWNDQSRLDDQPVRCWRVLTTTDQIIESDNCFGPGDHPRLPVIIMQRPVPSQIAGAPMINETDYQPDKILVESPWGR